jgi:hypothetical protein
MHSHGIALWRWLTWHRYQLALASGLVFVAALFLASAPVLLVIGAFEWKSSHRRLLGLAIFGLLTRSVACAQCGAPIEAPSKAWYCSPACRRYARLERDTRSPDPWLAERAETRDSWRFTNESNT